MIGYNALDIAQLLPDCVEKSRHFHHFFAPFSKQEIFSTKKTTTACRFLSLQFLLFFPVIFAIYVY